MSERGGQRLTDEQRVDWLRLIRTENVGPRMLPRAAQPVRRRRPGARRACPSSPAAAAAMSSFRPRGEVEDEIAASAKLGVRFVAIGEPDYPAYLRRSEDSPPLLAVRGNAAVLLDPAVAVVGARNASAAGLRIAGVLARDLGQAGFAIVSGLARGIDSAGHRGCARHRHHRGAGRRSR